MNDYPMQQAIERFQNACNRSEAVIDRTLSLHPASRGAYNIWQVDDASGRLTIIGDGDRAKLVVWNRKDTPGGGPHTFDLPVSQYEQLRKLFHS